MKITITQSTLSKQLDLVGKIATKHATLAVLQCVLLEVNKNTLCIKATNLEIAAEVTVTEVSIESPGIVAVPASILIQTLQFSKDEKVTLTVLDSGVLEISTRHTVTTINTIPHDEFPVVNKLDGESVVLNGAQFALGIKTASVAASQSSIKPELGSVYIYQNKEQSLTFVATDSFRLMEKTVAQKGVVLDTPILVPQKNALELARFCDVLQSNPALFVTENQCALQFDEGVYVISRLVAGTFPDYTAIIPKEFSTFSTVVKQDLVTALKKTNVFLNKFRQVRLQIQPTDLVISSQNNEIGKITDTISAQTEGEELGLSFNQQYLQDPLPFITDDSLYLQFAGIGRPMVMTGVNDKNLRYLVMPMNK